MKLNQMVWYSGDIMSGIKRKNVKLRMTGSVLTGPTAFPPYLHNAKQQISLCMHSTAQIKNIQTLFTRMISL